jgi:class 3 adenylate cyclase
VGAPTGTVTLLFTDVEGSTKLLERLGDGYGDAIAAHHRAVREALERHGGYEVDTAGDGFFATFARPGDAVACALEIQAALAQWPARVRMGIHTGTPE